MKMTRFEPIRTRVWRLGPILALLMAAAVPFACTPLGEEGTSINRGDQAYAKGDLEEALAEYRLALTQGASDPDTYARIAHTYVGLKRIDEGREYFGLAVAEDSSFADQAMADFVRLAREEAGVGDHFGMASAVQTALEFQPGINLEDLALPLAQHYSEIREYERALPFYQKALADFDPDSLPQVLFETGVAFDEIGDCESAVVFYEDYRDRIGRYGANRSEVDWRLGSCSYRLARLRRDDGDDDEALRHLEILLLIGQPQNLQAEGYFELGEILGLRGECEASVEAFQQVAVMDLAGTGPLVERAQVRIDQILFGGRVDRSRGFLRPQENRGSCFPPDSRIGRERTSRGGGG